MFAGLIQKVSFIQEGELFFIRIRLQSSSVLCDQKEENRTYQDISKTYKKIALSVADKSNAVLAFTLNKEEKPAKPVIQYAETDWKFLMRLASYLHGVLYPDTGSFIPYIWMGLPCRKNAVEFSGIIQEEHGISSQYFKSGGSSAGYVPADFEYYKVSTVNNYEIGTPVLYQDGSWFIIEKTVRIRSSELIFTYRLAKKSFIRTRKSYNPLFAGMTLLGNVIETDCETLKIQFDIDKNPNNEKAYPYQWVPDTGSVMYCMPKIGTKVSVYFSNEDEWSAKVINCIRMNGASCAKLSDPNQRMLSTEHGKELFLNPDSVGIAVKESANSFKLLDELGVMLESGMAIDILGEKEVSLKAKK